MIRARARRRRCSLDDVQPAHFFFTFSDASLRGKVARVAKRAGQRGKKVSVERENALSFTEVVNRVYWLAKSHHGAGARVVVIHRLVLVPFGLRKVGKNSFHLRGQRL